jgi:hypothetical protein
MRLTLLIVGSDITHCCYHAVPESQKPVGRSCDMIRVNKAAIHTFLPPAKPSNEITILVEIIRQALAVARRAP